MRVWSLLNVYDIEKPLMALTLFRPVFHFYIPWKRQKTYGFLTFPGVIERNIGLKWVNVHFGCIAFVFCLHELNTEYFIINI